MQTYNTAGLLKTVSPYEQLDDRLILSAKTVCDVTHSSARDLIADDAQPVFSTATIVFKTRQRKTAHGYGAYALGTW